MHFVFFCKQKTAYEVRIRDWSSDVCSSDLTARRGRVPWPRPGAVGRRNGYHRVPGGGRSPGDGAAGVHGARADPGHHRPGRAHARDREAVAQLTKATVPSRKKNIEDMPTYNAPL